MQLNEKIQKLRKQHNLTQEELAEALFVSRTAVSKWESGRGYPNIESLKAIAKFFSVTVDDLLSSDELLTIAEEDNKQKENHLRNTVFGLLDISAAVLFFLPFFGQKSKETIYAVSLPMLTEIHPHLKAAYLISVSAIIIWGIITLVFQNVRNPFFVQSKEKVSLILSGATTLLFIGSTQPYAAAFSFIFLMIKIFILIKNK